MYICRECKTEYKEKVDYCDSGNNTFDYVEDKTTIATTKTKSPMTLEQKAELVSRIFFGICIILSIIVWSIPIGKNPPKRTTTPQPKQTQTDVYIPNINKIWDDTPIYRPKPQPTQQVQEQTPLDKLRQEIPLTFAPIENKKIVQADVQKKNLTSAVKPAPKKVQQTATAQTFNPKVQPKTSNKSTKLNEAPLYKEPAKPTYNPNSPTMLRYKNNLRSALFTQFAVGSISGVGECSIQFAIDKNGKLLNRKFSQESSNKALNDAVYYMLMSVPKFDAPPSEYNGQIIRMNFKINNGNYEISIH